MAHYYGHQPPNMKPVGYEMHDVNIQMAPHTMNENKPRWSWCSVVWSAIVTICCCPLFGFIGLLCASYSYVDHKADDHAGASRKRKCAWGWSMSGLILGILFIVAIVVIYTVFWVQISKLLYQTDNKLELTK